MDNIRGIRSQKGAAGERSVFTFAFGLTTAGLDHLNSFDSMAESPHGNVVEAFENCSGCPLKRSSRQGAPRKSPPNADNIMHRSELRRVQYITHSNGDKKLEVDCPGGWPDQFCFGEGRDRRGVWPDTLPSGMGFTRVDETMKARAVRKDVFDLAELKVITPDTLFGIRSKRISHLSYKGPDGNDTRYKISNTLKLVLMPPRFENMVLYLNSFDPPRYGNDGAKSSSEYRSRREGSTGTSGPHSSRTRPRKRQAL